MSERQPSNKALWEEVKNDILAESPAGVAGSWTPTKEQKAIERYVDLGGQYDRAEALANLAESDLAREPDQLLLGDAPTAPPPTTAMELMADIEADLKA